MSALDLYVLNGIVIIPVNLMLQNPVTGFFLHDPCSRSNDRGIAADIDNLIEINGFTLGDDQRHLIVST